MDGILSLNKPAGLSSFATVARVRRLTRAPKAGHGGTLDPLATGVLPVFLGQATRLMEYMAELPKAYRAVVELGTVTETYDAEGKVLRQGDASGVMRAQVEAALASFRGDIMQVPPAYSALKQQGRPLYRLARQGAAPALEKRPVSIYRLELLDFVPPLLTLATEVSRGTYIRSLAYDLGEVLGCGAYLKALTRTAYGPFNITEAVTLEQLERAVTDGSWTGLVQPLDVILSAWPAVKLDAAQALAVVQGKALPFDITGTRARAYDPAGRFLAILCLDAATKLWKPHKVFLPKSAD